MACSLLAAAALMLLIAGTDRTEPNSPSEKSDDFMAWCTIADASNTGEPSGSAAGGFGPTRICGRVDYVYRIGKYEVTNAQYCVFLNAVASTADPHGLYNPQMAEHRLGGIRRFEANKCFTYVVKPRMAQKPVNFVSFFDACRFANWMHNGRGDADTETGAYTLKGVSAPTNASVKRNPGARVAIASEDEWYKAAYYKGGNEGGYWDYAMQSDAPPTAEAPPGEVNSANYNDALDRLTFVGAYRRAPSAYGTFDQSGNIWEWNETTFERAYRAARGGCFGSNPQSGVSAAYRTHNPTYWKSSRETQYIGFRVVKLPAR
jgi:formylglycine-generating enzyme required for sulfatase activity